MKAKNVYLPIILSLLLTATTPSYAQSLNPSASPSSRATPSPSTSPQSTTKPLASSRAAEIRESIDQKRMELQVDRERMIRTLAKTMVDRLQAAHDRQNKIVIRLQSRIGKLKEAKRPTSNSERQVTTLTNTLTTQQALIDAIIPNLDKMLSENNNQTVQTFRDSIKKATDSISKTQLAIKDTFTQTSKIAPSPSPTISTPSGTPTAEEKSL